LSVPEGQLKIAQGFNLGTRAKKSIASPEGTVDTRAAFRPPWSN